jgi:hypothetical protein
MGILICVVIGELVDVVWCDSRYSQTALEYLKHASFGGPIGISTPNLGHLWRLP